MENQTMLYTTAAYQGTLKTRRDTADVQRCRVCGCTNMNACWDPKVNHPCYWVEDDLCSACVGEQQL